MNVLTIAGIAHFLRPEAFMPAMPGYLPWHRELILLTGGLELVAAVGLCTRRFRHTTAWWLIAYFVAILPAHFHVAIHRVPMFGVDDPLWLWGRIPFQAVFLYAAWLIAKEDVR